MKRTSILITAIWVMIESLLAQNTKEINLTFDRTNFVIEQNKDLEGFITVKNLDFVYDENPLLPCLPFMMVSVAISADMQYLSVEMIDQKVLFAKDIVLANNPVLLSTGKVSATDSVLSSKYQGGVYPNERVEYVCESNFEDYSILVFRVTPFEYDSEKQKLYFSDRITLNIHLSENVHLSEPAKMARMKNHKRTADYDRLKRIVVNPDDITSVAQKKAPSITNRSLDHIDYVIVTSSALQTAFDPLIKWKNMKGVRTKIITTEYIKEHYSGAKMQLKIKKCLYDYYQNNELQFALLGGDDTVVPVQKCYAFAGTKLITDMPTDLYYGCFEGTFDWNKDGDNWYGEQDDGVNLFPSIYVTRAPVRTIEDVNAFVNKTLVYEKTPTQSGWNNQILMCGSELIEGFRFPNGQSDAEAFGELLYASAPFWDISRKRFYDTCTDFPDDSLYEFNASNLQNQISTGYSFINVISHGDNNSWKMEGKGNYYNRDYAALSKGSQPCIITTMACMTNAFDNTDDPCLSESFIRNPNNGIVAYLGCSRDGWFYSGTKQLSLSLTYDSKFYQELLLDDEFRNFGKVVAEAKYTQQAAASRTGAERWIMFGLNPIGDAEMPIYTTTPMLFDDVSIVHRGNNIFVDSKVEGCRICVMSADDMGASYYEVRDDAECVVFDGINTDVTICITKHNYIPYIATIGVTFIQNETVIGPQAIENDVVVIGSDVIATKPSGAVMLKGSGIAIKSGVTIIEDGTTIDANANITLKNN